MDWKALEKVVERVVNSPWAKATGLTTGLVGFTWVVLQVTGTDGQVKKVLRLTHDDSGDQRDVAISDHEAQKLGG